MIATTISIWCKSVFMLILCATRIDIEYRTPVNPFHGLSTSNGSIGDAIMALFDSPDDAMKASVEMLKALMEYNVEHEKAHHKPLGIGVGLHKGRVRLGTIGESGRMDGTVISDAVNLASRIESLTKFYGVQCLISENIYHSLSEPDRHSIRYVDKVKVKGKHVPVRIFEEFSADPLEIQNRKRLTLGTFEEATRFFETREFARAKTLFEKVLQDLPEDKASKSYITRCDHYANRDLPEDWDGALDFDFK